MKKNLKKKESNQKNKTNKTKRNKTSKVQMGKEAHGVTAITQAWGLGSAPAPPRSRLMAVTSPGSVR